MEAVRRQLVEQFKDMGYQFTSPEAEDLVVAFWILSENAAKNSNGTITSEQAFNGFLSLHDKGVVRDVVVNNDEVKYYDALHGKEIVCPFKWGE